MHRLTEVDADERQAQCEECGSVRIKRTSKGGWRCGNADKKWSKNRRTGVRREWLYGVTDEQVSRMREKQGGGCAICREPMLEEHLDHDHVTGAVRGLLCRKHNIGLGMFDDNPELLEAAAVYLRTLCPDGPIGKR